MHDFQVRRATISVSRRARVHPSYSTTKHITFTITELVAGFPHFGLDPLDIVLYR